MRKLAKMSLVAAVAVTGMTSSASAKSLSDAIKDTTINGSVEYRMASKSVEVGSANKYYTGEDAKINVFLNSKVNDNVTFGTQLLLNTQGKVAGRSYGETDEMKNTAFAAMNVMQAKFTIKTNGATIIAGAQGLATPWTDAVDGARANGVLALVPAGPVTVAGAFFTNSKMGIDTNGVELGSANIGALAVIGKADIVNYQAWYLTFGSKNSTSRNATAMTGVIDKGGNAVAVLADVDAGVAKVNASYASLEGDTNSANTKLKKQTLIKAIVTAPLQGVTVVGGFAKGGKDGDLVTFDPDAKVGFESWNIAAGTSNTQCDLSAATIAAVVPVNGVDVKAQYTTVTYDAANTATTGDTKANEILLEATYKMSKNFITDFKYAQIDQDDKASSTAATVNTKISRAELSLKYKF